MWHSERLGAAFFVKLAQVDEQITAAVAAGGCPRCGGPLHRSDYVRKPRGGLAADTPEVAAMRYSLCCGRRGCRKRALPPSVRFLGRRVYWEAVVLLASAHATARGLLWQAQRATGIARKTLRRWLGWWRTEFVSSSQWTVMRARFVPPPPDESKMPQSLLERLAAELSSGAGVAAADVLAVAARWLAPVTTGSVPDSSRFVWGSGCPGGFTQKMGSGRDFRVS